MLGVSRFARRKQAAPAPRVKAPENVQWLLQEAQAPPAKRPVYHSKVRPGGRARSLCQLRHSVQRRKALWALAAALRLRRRGSSSAQRALAQSGRSAVADGRMIQRTAGACTDRCGLLCISGGVRVAALRRGGRGAVPDGRAQEQAGRHVRARVRRVHAPPRRLPAWSQPGPSAAPCAQCCGFHVTRVSLMTAFEQA